MKIFKFSDGDALGKVQSVDTANVVVGVERVELLRQLQVNRLVVLQSSRAGQHLIGIVQKITRTAKETIFDTTQDGEVPDTSSPETNLVRIALIGTLIDRLNSKENVFRRTLETVPEIDANCFALEGVHLTAFMRVVSQLSGEEVHALSLGKYTLDENAEAYLNGDKLFQRHALIVGSTGSGKSWTTAHLLEQISALPNANAVLFDIHGEYRTLVEDGIKHYRIAGPADLQNGQVDEKALFLPYWLLNYEDMEALLLDRSDSNAPNQAMVFSRAVINAKTKYLAEGGYTEVLNNFTIDSPVFYSMDAVLAELNTKNSEMVPGAKAGTEKQGDFNGKLSRFIARLENKLKDRRLGFLFQPPESSTAYDWLPNMAVKLLAGTKDQSDNKGGVKIINFSEVPSDILPVIISLVARLLFSIQQWTAIECRHPISLFCDEAHLYVPQGKDADSVGTAALRSFERIAKEGRKYGVGLVVISQRPSEVSRTVLSQCNNVIAMRLTNAEDQNVVRRLLPDSLGGFSDLLPVLDVGEALVVGDASLLPSRVRIAEPRLQPESNSINFWTCWARDEQVAAIENAVQSLRMQSHIALTPSN